MKRKWTANLRGYLCRLQAKQAQTAHVRYKVGLGVTFLNKIPLPPSSPPFFLPTTMQIDMFLHLKFHPPLTFLNDESLHPGQHEAPSQTVVCSGILGFRVLHIKKKNLTEQV